MTKKTSRKSNATSSPAPAAQAYESRDIVLGKVKGYPPWPGMIMEESKIPANVLKERPQKKKEPTYCVQFFPDANFSWLEPKSISKLQKHEIESYIADPFKKSADLLTGYRIALDPKKWEDEREAALMAADDEEEDEQEDQLEEEEEGSSKPKGKKRKRESTVSAKAGRKKGAKKSKMHVESEDDGEGEEDEEAAVPEKKTKKDKVDAEDAELAKDPEAQKVREWRHKLQKVFLNSSKAIPKEEDMPAMDDLFKTVETYDKMDISYLSFSKIGKVMRHIAALPIERVPRDVEFKFRDRAQGLVDVWGNVVGANPPSQGKDMNGAVKRTEMDVDEAKMESEAAA